MPIMTLPPSAAAPATTTGRTAAATARGTASTVGRGATEEAAGRDPPRPRTACARPGRDGLPGRPPDFLVRVAVQATERHVARRALDQGLVLPDLVQRGFAGLRR